MGIIKEAALSFRKLLDVEYKIVLGKKGRLTEFSIDFEKGDFFHLVGLQYLKDIPQLKKNREQVFDDIISEKIKETDLIKSSFFPAIQERLIGFSDFESILDSNEIVFRYSKDKSGFSKIDSEYLLITLYNQKKSHIFLSSYPRRKNKFCKSFFFNDKNDYAKNQIKMTLLYKEKLYKSVGLSDVQFDKLTKQEVKI